MITFFSTLHERHAPEYEFFRGARVPCFEVPARAAFVRDELVARGHDLRTPTHDSAPFLPLVHAGRYLAFLESAWNQWLEADPANAAVQPFPSVWPVRSLRSDVEPADFTARLGLYSMDNGTPLVAGTWTAAKAAADETGEGPGAGFNLNLPLPPGTTADEWFSALEVARDRILEFAADALVVSLGLDAYAGDPISKFALHATDFRRLGTRLARLGLLTVLVLEGGYATKELGVNAANVLDGFEGA